MIGSFQAAHVKTMDAQMKEKVKMMMMRMNTNLCGHPETSGRPRKGSERKAGSGRHRRPYRCNPEAPGRHAETQAERMDMPGGKPMMQ